MVCFLVKILSNSCGVHQHFQGFATLGILCPLMLELGTRKFTPFNTFLFYFQSEETKKQQLSSSLQIPVLTLLGVFFFVFQEKRGLALDGKLKHEDTNLASSTM